MAEPTAPTAPTAVNTTVSAAKRTVAIANNAELASYLAGTFTSVPTWGDLVLLALGSYTPASPHTLPAASTIAGTQTGNDYITFASANYASMPAAGYRVQTSDKTNMPTCNAPVWTAGNGFFIVADSADHYRFVGLNFTTVGGVFAAGFVFVQSPSTSTNTATHPHHFLFEHCFFMPTLTTGDGLLGNAMQWCGSHIGATDCNLDDITRLDNSSEMYAILIPGGAGPYLLRNNRIVSSSCGVFVGGSVIANAGVIPSDITITRNAFERPAKWQIWSYIYNAGTAAMSSDGVTITLTGGTPDPSWVNTYYFTLPNDYNGSGYPAFSRLITGVSGNTMTLTSAWPATTGQGVAGGPRGTGSLTYRITTWNGQSAPPSSSKNFYEAKHASRVSLTQNIFSGGIQAAQYNSIALVSLRGNGAEANDILFDGNYVQTGPIAITVTSRPTDGFGQGFSAITAIAGVGATTEITMNGAIDMALGATIELSGLNRTELNGVWRGTQVTSTKFSIPVTLGGAWDGSNVGVSMNMYKAGTPCQRIKITNNLFENICDKDSCINNSVATSDTAVKWLQFNAYPQFTPTGGSDTALSTTGDWRTTDVLIEHNTVASPDAVGGRDYMRWMFYTILQGNAVSSYASVWAFKNFTLRNNITKMGDSNFSAPFIAYEPQSTGVLAGTAGLDIWNDTSRQVTKNVFFNPNARGVTTEQNSLTAATDLNNTVVAAYTDVGFTSYATGSYSGYALSGGSSYKNTATDGTDPGFNATTFAAGISGVEAGTPAAGIRYLPVRWP